MTGVIMRIMSGVAGPYAVAGVLALGATGWAAAAVQTVRLGSAEKAASAVRRERDGAFQALGRCQAGLVSVRRTVDAQSAAVDRLAEEGRRRTGAAQAAVAAARRGRASAEQRAAGLLRTPPAGGDDCARAQAVRDAVIGAL